MFETLQFWHWWVIAVALIALELSISGAYFFLWLGASAGVVGLLAAVPGVGWEAQLFAFATLSIVSVFLWRRYLPEQKESDQPALNKRGHRYIGQLFTLNQPIVNGVGKFDRGGHNMEGHRPRYAGRNASDCHASGRSRAACGAGVRERRPFQSALASCLLPPRAPGRQAGNSPDLRHLLHERMRV